MKSMLVSFFIVGAIFSSQIAESSALTKPFNGYVNKAVANTITRKLQTMGFAANDPIYGVTLAAAENTLAAVTIGGSVAATVAAVGTAPVWLSVALGIGAAYEIYDFTMGQYELRANPATATVQITTVGASNTPAPPDPHTSVTSPPSVLPVDYSDPGVGAQPLFPNDQPLCASWTYPSGSIQPTSTRICGASVALIYQQADTFFRNSYIRYSLQQERTLSSLTSSLSNPTKINCTINTYICPQGVNYSYIITLQAIGTWPDGSALNSITTSSFQVFNNPSYLQPSKNYSLNDAVAKLNTADLTARADPELLAALANKIWQQAAQQPGYAGAPYDVANPVTAADVLADIAAGVYPHPTVADLLTLVSANAQTAPRLDPAAQPVEATEASLEVDFGPDPGIAQPTLETAPTGSAIVSQVMGLLPSLSGFTMPAHTSECTAPSFTFFGGSQTMQPMCDLLEEQRVLLSTIFSAVWGVVSLGIVLKA